VDSHIALNGYILACEDDVLVLQMVLPNIIDSADFLTACAEEHLSLGLGLL
jgi:hypothetical protein